MHIPDISIISKKQNMASSTSHESSIVNYWPIAATVIAVAVVYGLLFRENIIIKKEISGNRETFSQNEAVIKQTFGVSSYELADKINGLSQILSSRLYWSNFLGRDNGKLFNPDVIIKDSKLDMKAMKISFTGTVSGYEGLQRQLDDLKKNKDFVRDFSLVSSSFVDNSVNFKIDVTFKQDILKGAYSF